MMVDIILTKMNSVVNFEFQILRKTCENVPIQEITTWRGNNGTRQYDARSPNGVEQKYGHA